MILCYNFFTMQNTSLKYNVIIKKEGKYYVAYVPTLGISDFGKNLDQAKKNIQNAMECHIEGLLKTKTEVPAPDSQEYFIGQTEISFPKVIKLAI